jgi:hypothetical protein
MNRQATLTIDTTAVPTAVRPTHYEVVLVLVVLRDSPRDQQDWCGLLMGVRGHGW